MENYRMIVKRDDRSEFYQEFLKISIFFLRIPPYLNQILLSQTFDRKGTYFFSIIFFGCSVFFEYSWNTFIRIKNIDSSILSKK